MSVTQTNICDSNFYNIFSIVVFVVAEQMYLHFSSYKYIYYIHISVSLYSMYMNIYIVCTQYNIYIFVFIFVCVLGLSNKTITFFFENQIDHMLAVD